MLAGVRMPRSVSNICLGVRRVTLTSPQGLGGWRLCRRLPAVSPRWYRGTRTGCPLAALVGPRLPAPSVFGAGTHARTHASMHTGFVFRAQLSGPCLARCIQDKERPRAPLQRTGVSEQLGREPGPPLAAPDPVLPEDHLALVTIHFISQPRGVPLGLPGDRRGTWEKSWHDCTI